jgi:MFS family permease
MRVVRRSSLNHLFPLPDGMHFTPAMSARAIFSDAIEIGEVDMPYKERIGKSKLRLIRDGLRFLLVITEATFLYRPARPLILCAILLFTIGALLMLPPLQYYLQSRKVLEWMIYRFLVSNLFGTAGCLCFCAGYLTEQIAEIALSTEISKARKSFLQRFFQGPWLWAVAILLILIGGALVSGSVLQRIETGETYEHWSRYIVMTFCFSAAITLFTTRTIDYVMQLVRDRVRYWQDAILPRFRPHQLSFAEDSLQPRFPGIRKSSSPGAGS